jgi:hypothetical protein
MDLHHVISEKRERVREDIRERMNTRQRAQLPTYEEGQVVWVHDQAYHLGKHHNRDLKLNPTWIGPFVVLDGKENRVSYQVRPLGGSTRITYHAEHLRPFVFDDGDVLILAPRHVHHEDTDTTVPQPKRIGTRYNPKLQGTHYVVEAVVGHRWQGD